MNEKASDQSIRDSTASQQRELNRVRLDRIVDQVDKLHRAEPSKAMRFMRQGMHLADELGDKKSRFELLLRMGRMEARKGQLYQAEQTLKSALGQLPGRRADKDSLCRIYLALGAVYYLQQKNQLALEFYSQALACNEDKYKMNLYLNIANLYFTNANYPKSLHYQRKALRLAKDQKDVEHQVFCLSNIGAIYVKKEQIERALLSFEDALSMINMHNGSDYMRCSCELNLGDVRGKLMNWQEAEQHYKSAIRIADNNQFHQELAKAYLYLGELKLQLNDERSFLYYLYRSRKLARQKNFESLLIDVLRLLQHFFEERSDFKQAYGYLKEMAEVQASIEHNKQQQELSQLLDAKDKEISILERQRDQIEEQRHKLERYNRELEQSNRDLEQYAYVVAHDLKEPLRNISSFTSLIQQRYTSELDDTAQEYMNFVIRNSARMNALLTELLRYTTLRRPAKSRELETSVENVVQQVVRDLEERMNNKGVIFSMGELPELKISYDHLYQLFFSLVDNALQFNASEKPEIHVQCEPQGDHYEFSIRDNGIGIAPEYQEKIFKLFQRLDKERYHGTGIGLTLCRKIVQLYDGEIWLESEPGKGSVFYFTLRDN